MTAIILTTIYLVYLSLICQTIVIYDSIGYEVISAKMLHGGLFGYLKDGLQREPVYPALMAFGMHLSHVFSVDQRWTVKLVQIALLVVSQLLALRLLLRLGVPAVVRWLTVFYMGISPALANSTMWIYSEIAAMPLVLLAVLAGSKAWEKLSTGNPTAAIRSGALFGLSLAALVFVKNIFEVIAPLLMLPLLIASLGHLKNDRAVTHKAALAALVACAAAFYVPVTGYKFLNQSINGNFAFTDRGGWALYGNTARRVEKPLDAKLLGAALAYIPSPHFCYTVFDPDHCDWWSYKPSDVMGFAKWEALKKQGLSEEKLGSAVISASIGKVAERPFQYTFLAFLETWKMLFWETSKNGQVTYPDWVEALYNTKWFDPLLVIVSALLSLAALIWMIRRLWETKAQNGALLFITLMLTAYAAVHSLFFVLQRYPLPIAPLWIISISWMCHDLYLRRQHRK